MSGKHKPFQICKRCKRPLSWDNFDIVSETKMVRDGNTWIQKNHRRICHECLNKETSQLCTTTWYTCIACRRSLPVTMYEKTKHRKQMAHDIAPRMMYSRTCNECKAQAKKRREREKMERAAGKVVKRKLTKAETYEAKEKRFDEFCDRAMAMGLSYGKLKALERRERLKIEQEQVKRSNDSLLSCLRGKVSNFTV